MNKIFSIIVVSIFFSSCAFDNLFLFTSKLNKKTTEKQIVDYPSKDTITIQFSKGFSPNFIDNKKDTLNFDIFSSLTFAIFVRLT